MVHIALITDKYETHRNVTRYLKMFRWISCYVFPSIDDFLKYKSNDFKLVIFDNKIVDNEYETDYYNITERVYLVKPKIEMLFLPKYYLSKLHIRRFMMKIFQKSLCFDIHHN